VATFGKLFAMACGPGGNMTGIGDVVPMEGVHLHCECGRVKRIIVRVEAEPAQAQATSNNSDYATALNVYDEYMEHETTSRYSLGNFREWLKQRLNAEIPHCA
jgi:hypothetical protein